MSEGEGTGPTPEPPPTPAKKAARAGKAAKAAKAAKTAKAAKAAKKAPVAETAKAAKTTKAGGTRSRPRKAVSTSKAASVPTPTKAGARAAGPEEPPPPPPPPLPPPPPPPLPPPPPPRWWAQSPPGSPPPTPASVDALALTALVLGIVAVPMFIFFVPAILAVVLGLLGRRNVKVDPAKSGKGMATAGIVLGALSLLGAVVFVVALATSADDSDDSARYSVLQTGDCYDNEHFDEGNVELRACNEDHRREAFAVIDHPAPPGTEYPGRERLRRYAARECTARFAAYVGKAYEDSRLDIVLVLPRRDAWEDEGLRRIVCAAGAPDDADLRRTVRDSGV